MKLHWTSLAKAYRSVRESFRRFRLLWAPAAPPRNRSFLNDHKDSLVEHTREAATIGARRDAIKLRIVDSGTAIDDFAHELLGAYPNAMVLRDADIYKGPFPSYALAIADQGESFDIRLVDFDPRNSLASIEKAVLEAAGSASPGDLASVAELPGRAGRRL